MKSNGVKQILILPSPQIWSGMQLESIMKLTEERGMKVMVATGEPTKDELIRQIKAEINAGLGTISDYGYPDPTDDFPYGEIEVEPPDSKPWKRKGTDFMRQRDSTRS